jgi:hypothetical protein
VHLRNHDPQADTEDRNLQRLERGYQDQQNQNRVGWVRVHPARPVEYGPDIPRKGGSMKTIELTPQEHATLLVTAAKEMRLWLHRRKGETPVFAQYCRDEARYLCQIIRKLRRTSK